MLDEAFLRLPLAHRAYHDRAAGRPENSRAAVRAAVEAGYGIEIDVQVSSDGAAMVFHDDRLDRLTHETGPVAARTAEALGGTGLRDGEEGIPTLSEVLELVAGQVPLLIEIKDQSHRLGPVEGRLERAVADAVAGYEGPLAVMSFNPHAIEAFAAHAPGIALGLTTCAFTAREWRLSPARRAELRSIRDFERLGAAFISHDRRDLGRPRVAELKQAGVPILSWTIRSAAEEAAARQVADGITFEGYAAKLP